MSPPLGVRDDREGHAAASYERLIVDAHVHLFDRGFLPPAWYRWVGERWGASKWPNRDPQLLDVEDGIVDAQGELLMAELDRAGIDRCICHTLDWGVALGEADVPIPQVHRYYSDLSVATRGRFVPVAGVDPRRPDAVVILQQAVEELRLSGLKLYPPCGFAVSDEICFPLYEKCIALEIPVVIHTALIGFPHIGSYANPVGIAEVQFRYPELTLVLAHSGFPVWADEAMIVAAAHPRTYLEISNWNELIDENDHSLARMLLRMRDAVGAHRMLFGSDHLGGRRFSGPRSKLAEWIHFVEELPETARQLGRSIGQDEIDLILGRNAERVFGLAAAQP